MEVSKKATEALNNAGIQLDEFSNNVIKKEALDEDRKKLSKDERDLKEIRNKIFGLATLTDMKNEIKEGVLKGRIAIPQKRLKAVKETMCKSLENAISEIVIIQMALEDENFDKHLGDFLKKFRFVVNYPDVDKLNSLIGDEVGQDFTLLHADLVKHSFERDMLDWFKEKGGRFLSIKNAKFFSSIKENLTTLVTIDISILYLEKLRGYGIGFD